MIKLKRHLIVNSVMSIFEDLERLPYEDKEEFMKTHQSMLRETMYDPDIIDFKLIDIDAVLDKERTLVRTLYKRDSYWFSHKSL